MEKRRQPEVIAGRVNADGTIAAGDGFTVVKGGAGVYTVAFSPNFRVVGASASLAVGVAGSVSVDLISLGGGVWRTWNTAGTLVDNAFSFVAVGAQT